MAKKKATALTKAPPSTAKKSRPTIAKAFERQKGKIKKNDEQQQLDQVEDSDVDGEDENSEENSEQSQQDESNEGDDENSDDQESSSITPVKPENYALKQMSFRERRGTKMKTLMDRKKQEEEDPFWAEHKGYFGDINASDDEDEEDYVQSSQGKDQFDSDFGETESEHDDEPEQDEKKIVDEMDQQKEKEKKRKAQLMKKINAYKQKPQRTQKVEKAKVESKDIKAEIKVKKPKPQQKIEQVGNRYIHQMFTQEQLLGQAAHTEYYNWLSLKKLISIQTQKKDFTRKVKHVDGDKVIFKDRLSENGTRQVTYELSGVSINSINDLTAYWEAK